MWVNHVCLGSESDRKKSNPSVIYQYEALSLEHPSIPAFQHYQFKFGNETEFCIVHLVAYSVIKKTYVKTKIIPFLDYSQMGFYLPFYSLLFLSLDVTRQSLNNTSDHLLYWTRFGFHFISNTLSKNIYINQFVNTRLYRQQIITSRRIETCEVSRPMSC